MTLADDAITALRLTHDHLVARVRTLSDADLAAPSGSSEWPVAQVLSHLGSGAQITLYGLQAALSGGEPAEKNEQVWARWDAMSPREQADGFLQADATLVEALEALTPEQRAGVRYAVPYLPDPAGLDFLTTVRLNEAALHAWDVDVAFDPHAVLPAGAAAPLLEGLAGALAVLMRYYAKPDRLAGRTPTVDVRAGDARYHLVVGAATRLLPGPAPAPDAVLTAPPEAIPRLVSGRLAPGPRTPSAVVVSGELTLDELRTLFAPNE
ncbi:MAG: maleylpyruvate isomerase family mycothiol-dependent enzyme [Actinomycetota bacterium]|nr:maleylpyruvate isomerase family mycothiol-dependent enzyme [Actinomycetota bacterium]